MDFGSLAKSIVSPVGGVVSGIIQNIGQRKQQEKAFEHDVQMWNSANYYNSPEQQMARLEKAGLNPNLVYGNGSVVGNTSTQTPKYQAPQLQRIPLEHFNPLEILGTYQDLRQKKANADLAENAVKYADFVNSEKLSLLQENVRGQMWKNLQGEWSNMDPSKLPEYTKKSWFAQGMTTKLNKYSAETDSINMRTALMNFEKEFMDKIPKEWQWLAPLLMRLFGR